MNEKIKPEIQIDRTVPLLPDRSKAQPSAPGSIERKNDIENRGQLAHPTQERAPLVNKPKSVLKPLHSSFDSPETHKQNTDQNFFSEDDLKELRKELSAMPMLAAICFFTVQLLGVLAIVITMFMRIFSGDASDGDGGTIISASVWTIVWCLGSIWVCAPLARLLKLKNSSEINLSSGIPLYGPIVIWKLAKKAKETLKLFP